MFFYYLQLGCQPKPD